MIFKFTCAFGKICITGYFQNLKIYIFLTKENVLFGLFLKDET